MVYPGRDGGLFMGLIVRLRSGIIADLLARDNFLERDFLETDFLFGDFLGLFLARDFLEADFLDLLRQRPVERLRT